MPESRTVKPDSLASVVAELLRDFEVPIPNDVVRTVASERRGSLVAPEQLGRLLAYEKRSVLGGGPVPLLCQAIDRRALAYRPRLWCLGDWRLGRRIATPDVIEKWQVQTAVKLIEEMLLSSRSPSEQLGSLAAEAISRVIGPIGYYLPGSREQWEEFRTSINQEHWDWNPSGMTVQQHEAETALAERNLPAISLYFGGELSVLGRTDSLDPIHLRLAVEGERGKPFDRVVLERLGGDEDRARTVLAYLQAWSHLRDDLGRAPSSAEFANRWRFSPEEVSANEALFQMAFPDEEGPERVIRMLEEGLPDRGRLAWLMGVAVIDESPPADVVLVAPGQVWEGDNGSKLTIAEVDGPTIIGHLSQSGTTAIWVGNRDELAKAFRPYVPGDLWQVKFEVDVLPTDLLGPLTGAGFVTSRMSRPGEPHPDRPPRVGVIEAQVVAEDADDARNKLIAALDRVVSLSPDEIRAGKLSQ